MKNSWLFFFYAVGIITICIESYIIPDLYAYDIVLGGNEVKVIENTTYTQTGNIYVRENAKLIIRNANLIMNDRYHEEYRIWVTGNGELEIIRSKIRSKLSNEVVLINLFDSSKLLMQDSHFTEHVNFLCGEASSGDHPVELFWGNVRIINSTFNAMDIVFSPSGGGNIHIENSGCDNFTYRFRDNYIGDFSDLQPGFFNSWSFRKDQYDIRIESTNITRFNFVADGSSHITARNSSIFHFSPYASEPTIYMHAIDSTIRNIQLLIFETNAEIWDLNTGYQKHLKLSEHTTGDSMPELILENTELKNGWYIGAYGNANITLDGIIFDRLSSYGGDNRITVSNSEINELMLYGAPNTTIINHNVLLKESINNIVPPNNAYILGDITFSKGVRIANWRSPCTIKRNFALVIKDQSGQGVLGIALNLYKNGLLVWSGQTDSTGSADFDLEFTDNNYSDIWDLEEINNGKSRHKNITLLTSSPIQFNDDEGGGGGGGGCFINILGRVSVDP